MSKFSITALTLLASFSAPKAFSWGVQGHRVVGEIAQHHISNRTRRRIAELVGDKTLAQIANWADDIRSDSSRDYVKPWHFVTVDDGLTYASAQKDPAGDVIVAIKKCVETLGNKQAPKMEREEALKLLVHFVGDIHQPLHVGRKDDMGGNAVKVTFFGANTNLHAVWDEGVIDSEKLSYTELAALYDHVSKKDIQDWQSAPVEAWAAESMEYRSVVYDLTDTIAPGSVKNDSNKSSSQSADKGNGHGDDHGMQPDPIRSVAAVNDPPSALPKIGYGYRLKARPIIEKRLLQGGVRLAGILDAVLK